jgi:hypothetical protein
MGSRKQTRVLPKPDYEAERAFRRFMRAVLDSRTATYAKEQLKSENSGGLYDAPRDK